MMKGNVRFGASENNASLYVLRDRFIVTDLSGHRKHSSTGDLLSIELQQVRPFTPCIKLYLI